MHPSPTRKKQWEKRRAIMGDGQDVLELEYTEWMSNENQEVIDLMDSYRKRLADEIWNKKGFKQDVLKGRAVYLKNIALPRSKQDFECLWKINKKLMDKYGLNNGYLFWLTDCVKTNENDPGKISLYDIGGKGPRATHLWLNVYFPLPDSVYQIAIRDLRIAELEKFGDYYSQEQKGGARKGTRPETAKKYRNLADWYHKACQSHGGELTEREFCRIANIPVSRLQRALKYVANNRLKSDK